MKKIRKVVVSLVVLVMALASTSANIRAAVVTNPIEPSSIMIVNNEGYEAKNAQNSDLLGVRFTVKNLDTTGISAGDTFSLTLPNNLRALAPFSGNILMDGLVIATYSCADLHTIEFTYQADIVNVEAFMANIVIKNLEMVSPTNGANDFVFLLNGSTSVTRTVNVDTAITPSNPIVGTDPFNKAARNTGNNWNYVNAYGSDWPTKWPITDPVGKYYYMRWEVTINLDVDKVSRMSDILIKDVIQYGDTGYDISSTFPGMVLGEHYLVEDSIFITAMEITVPGDENSAVPRGNLVRDVDYTLSVSADGKRFEIRFIESSSKVEPAYFYWVDYLTKRNNLDTDKAYTNGATLYYTDLNDSSSEKTIAGLYNNFYVPTGYDISSFSRIKATSTWNGTPIQGVEYSINLQNANPGTGTKIADIGKGPFDSILKTVVSDFIASSTDYDVTITKLPAGYYIAPADKSQVVSVGTAGDYPVTFELLRESFVLSYYVDTNLVSSENVYYGEKVTNPFVPVIPAGKTFVGWHTTSALTTLYDFNTAIFEDTSVYAKFEDIDYVAKFWDGADELTSLSQTKHYNEVFDEPTGVNVPTKAGYDFVGWYTDAALTMKYNFATLVSSDINLYAKWQKQGGSPNTGVSNDSMTWMGTITAAGLVVLSATFFAKKKKSEGVTEEA